MIMEQNAQDNVCLVVPYGSHKSPLLVPEWWKFIQSFWGGDFHADKAMIARA